MTLRNIDDLFEMFAASASIQEPLFDRLPAREIPAELENLSTCTCYRLSDIAAVCASLRLFGRTT
jgi:hypothetical protein